MEVDDSIQQTNPDLNNETGTENVYELWEFISNTIITLFSSFENEKKMSCSTEENYGQLNQLLASLLSNLNTLNILVHPVTSYPIAPEIQQQYTAFTTWLFGAMFYLISLPVTDTSLQKIVEIQVCMVRILSRLHLKMLNSITLEYLNILEDLSNFSNQNTQIELRFKKFVVEYRISDNFDLEPFPIIVKKTDVSTFQISILKIIIDSDVSSWPQDRLKSQLLDILVYSEPKVKLFGLNVCTEILQYSLCNHMYLETVIFYATEIVKSLPIWSQKSLVTTNACKDHINTFKEIMLSISDPTHINFHFEIFSLVVNNVANFDEIKIEICNKIEHNLVKCPKLYGINEIDKYLFYLDHSPCFMNIIVCFIVYEIENAVSHISKSIIDISKLWAALKGLFYENMQSERFDAVLTFLKLVNMLDYQLAQKKIVLNLINDDIQSLLTQFYKTLTGSNYNQIKLVFESTAQLISLGRIDKNEIQNILCLPWLDSSTLSAKTNKMHLANAKSLDFKSKVKCLNSISRYGTGRHRLDIMNMCLSNWEIELGVASVLNCPMLLLDEEIKFDDIVQQILIPALSQKDPVLEAVASVLGQLACIVSQNGKIIRNSADPDNWLIKCCCCDSMDENSQKPKVVNKKFETYFKSIFGILDSNSKKVHLNISANLIRLSNHLQCFNSNELAKKWVSYIQDDDEDIRINFSKAVILLLTNRITRSMPKESLQDEIPEGLEVYVSIIMDKIVIALDEAIESSNQSLHQTVLLTAKNAACIPSHLTERRSINVFLLTILNIKSSQLAVAVATDAYAEVALYHKTDLKSMYIRYKKSFLKIVMTFALHNRINYEYNMATSIHRVAKCMGFEGSRQLLRKDGYHAICFLLPQIIAYPKAKTLFHDIAEPTNYKLKHMFKLYFQHICCQCFLFQDTATLIKIFKLVFEITETSFSTLIGDSFKLIVSELMLHFHYQKQKILELLQFLAKFDNQEHVSLKTRLDFANFLNPMLHGILVTFDAYLSQNSEEIMQKYALSSLAELIQFMGPTYITPYNYKILTTLRTALSLTRPGFRKLACIAWNAFLRNTSITELGPLLATICISLVPLLEVYHKDTNSMLDYLLIKNKDLIKEYYPDLFFINDLKISPNISTQVINYIKHNKPDAIEDNLRFWIKSINHETDEVRIKALRYLQQYLAKNRNKLNDLILSDINVDPLIVELLDTLMSRCQDKDEAIRIASGDCIGELGAIEPSLLPRRIFSRGHDKFISSMNEEFAYALFHKLVSLYHSQENTQSMDSFSLAIQDILEAYEISPEGKNSKMWSDLSPKIQRMITPLLTSHYTIVTNTNVEFSSPIYGSESGSTFEQWVTNWTLSMLKSIKHGIVSNVLKACRPAFRRSIKITIFCIPYIVAHIVLNSTFEETKKLSTEMLAVIEAKEKTQIDRELSKNRPLRTQVGNASSISRVSDEAKRVRCLQVVFSSLDHLQRWLRETQKCQDNKYEKIENFCKGFPKLLLAKGCYQSGEYHRALIYLEQHMASSKKGLSEPTEGGLLAKIYTQLEEPDGVTGMLVSQDRCPTLQQLVLAHQVNGQFQDAATCYERLLQSPNLKVQYLRGMIQCYHDLDQPFTAMNITKGVLEDRPELETLICDGEPFWQLTHFGKIGSNSRDDVKLNLLADLKNNIKPDIYAIKKDLVSLLTASSRPGAYEQSYSYIMKLHVMNEFEKACTMMLEDLENISVIFEEWEKRDKLINASRGAEFILEMRRAILDLAAQLQTNADSEKTVITEEIGKLWLKSAKNARKAGMYQQAYMYILSASDSCPPQDLYIEQAQLYWQKGLHEDALITLKRSLATYFKRAAEYKKEHPGNFTTERKQCAKAKLLWAKYNDETLNVDANVNMSNYKEAFEVWRAWEKSCLSIARYYESVVDKMTDEERLTCSGRDMQAHIVNYYGKSLLCGCKYIHQSLPRMLTVWLNYASRAHSALDQNVSNTSTQMTKIVETYIVRVPTFIWLTAFSQLVSRICHPDKDVQQTLFSIIIKLIKAYPQHCLWMMASVFNSSYTVRKKCCNAILNQESLKTTEMTKLIQSFNKLWERLIELSNKHIPEGSSTTTISFLSRSLPRLLADTKFGPIMMPTSKFRQLHLPMKGTLMDQHYPFALNPVTITGIADKVLVMQSLQRPRRITLMGSDGRPYLFMCKPKDDLRRDFRLMEFNDIVNKYLQNDPESRRRRLYIRTYSVVPLNEECGLIEWLSNLVGYRNILLNIYKDRNLVVSQKELRTMTCQLKDPLAKKREVFLTKLIPRHPPVLGDWFCFTFPDPYGWYEARTAYIRTAAVMSMVGYILGLGDRHGENILIDSTCGDCVHVDFNCLFNRGETLEWPERVPFRLTHNMVEAMGPLKYEGPFRQSCRTTMKVLREQASTLISVLKPFVYDPLVTWNRNQMNDTGEKTNEKAVEHIKSIEDRLKGMVGQKNKRLEAFVLYLSVEGQVNHLILDAINVDHLCQMYVGWGPFL